MKDIHRYSPQGSFSRQTHNSQDFELDEMRDEVGDEAQQPLIVDEEGGDGDVARPETTAQEANRLIWLLTLSAGLSGLLFGYE